ncbi:hypothetical protein MY11210_009315 [Beauveria gryllotalpidicola]
MRILTVEERADKVQALLAVSRAEAPWPGTTRPTSAGRRRSAKYALCSRDKKPCVAVRLAARDVALRLRALLPASPQDKRAREVEDEDEPAARERALAACRMVEARAAWVQARVAVQVARSTRGVLPADVAVYDAIIAEIGLMPPLR